MPQYHATRSTEIAASIDKVFNTVRDFGSWATWSPWLLAEPDCKVDIAEDGGSYAWDGRIVGSGVFRVTEENENKQIISELVFLKPYKSTNKTEFRFEELNGKTKVTWSIEGALPLFMFFMKEMMSAWIGMDYERGLRMLKELLETDSVASRLSFKPDHSFEGFPFIGIRSKCSIEEIGPQMKKDFKELEEFSRQKGIACTGKPFSVYHKADLVKAFFDYTAGVPVSEIPNDLPSGFVSGNMPSGKTYAIEHKGPYIHIGNAWAAGMMHGQSKLFKQDKKRLGFEVYENDPCKVDSADVLSTIHIPCK